MKLEKGIVINGIMFSLDELKQASEQGLDCEASYYCPKCGRVHYFWSKIGKKHMDNGTFFTCSYSCLENCPLKRKADGLVHLACSLESLSEVCGLLLELQRGELVLHIKPNTQLGVMATSTKVSDSVKVEVRFNRFVGNDLGDDILFAYDKYKKLDEKDKKKIIKYINVKGKKVSFDTIQEAEDMLALLKLDRLKELEAGR